MRPDFIEYMARLVDQYPIVSIEDGLHEIGNVVANAKLGDRTQLVGDDLSPIPAAYKRHPTAAGNAI